MLKKGTLKLQNYKKLMDFVVKESPKRNGNPLNSPFFKVRDRRFSSSSTSNQLDFASNRKMISQFYATFDQIK